MTRSSKVEKESKKKVRIKGKKIKEILKKEGKKERKKKIGINK